MLHDKSIKRIDEIQVDFNPNALSIEKIRTDFKALQPTESFSEFNRMNSRGYSFKTILTLLIWMIVFPDKTVSSSLETLHDTGMNMGKDVFYHLKNKESICWRRILWYIATKSIYNKIQ
ncbi:MAG: hypothetical protein LBH90_09630 [Tannerella sp.]|jgi:hypothetical protein|nr:hypothetical protein [Tannerella sp.]